MPNQSHPKSFASSAATGPKNEKGIVFYENTWPSPLNSGNWQDWANQHEKVNELRWPQSNDTFESMMNDAQIEGLYKSSVYQIRRYRWFIDPNGASEIAVRKLAEDLQLPILDQPPEPQPRTRNRFNFREHMRLALLAPAYGHYYFEQVGYIDPDGWWRISKLAERPPWTIIDISVDDDGGLEWVAQEGPHLVPQTWPNNMRRLNVDRLLCYVFDMRGGNWFGRSMLRSLYKNYLSKDRLLRLDLIGHERNSVGIPIVSTAKGAPNSVVQQASQMAQQYKSGQFSGGAVPEGMEFALKGVEGNVKMPIDSVRYHDEQMARNFLQMFAQLGTTAYGSRALGEDFINFFALGVMAIADWFRDTFNMHMVEDWVDWNIGPEAPAPRLDYDRDLDPELSVTDMISMVDAGLIVMDEETEKWLRNRWNIPQRKPGSQPIVLPKPAAPPADEPADVAARRGRGGSPPPVPAASNGDAP